MATESHEGSAAPIKYEIIDGHGAVVEEVVVSHERQALARLFDAVSRVGAEAIFHIRTTIDGWKAFKAASNWTGPDEEQITDANRAFRIVGRICDVPIAVVAP